MRRAKQHRKLANRAFYRAEILLSGQHSCARSSVESCESNLQTNCWGSVCLARQRREDEASTLSLLALNKTLLHSTARNKPWRATAETVTTIRNGWGEAKNESVAWSETRDVLKLRVRSFVSWLTAKEADKLGGGILRWGEKFRENKSDKQWPQLEY